MSRLLTLSLALSLLAGVAFAAAPSSEEFIGPLAGWANLKEVYGAVGDGVADDTAALQKAFDELGYSKKYTVLYLPAGTYRLTKTLLMKGRLGVSILGEDPAQVKIVWDGAEGESMTWFNGVAYSRWGRITWDGRGKAKTAIDHGWEGKEPNAGTHNEHADEVFQDVGFGIRGGSRGFMDAETAVLRCKFLRCSSAGLSIENFNALDWYVWYSLFEDCNVGVTNTFGAGHYHVYHSVFRRSQVSDFTMGNLGYFSIRQNYSSGSKAFMVAAQFSGGSMLTIQGNTIVNTTDDSPLQVHNLGPLLLLDNTVISHPGAKAAPMQMTNSIPWGADLVAVGNTFTVDPPIVCNGRLRALDNQIKPTLPVPPEPQLPPTAPNLKRPVLELTPGCTTAELQAKLAEAVKLRGKAPVLHFRAGNYEITQTLELPPHCDAQLVGDGYIYSSRLMWKGQGAGPILRLRGPSQVRVRDLNFTGGGQAAGIVVDKCDVPGGRVFSEQLSTEGGLGIGLLVDGLDRCDVSFHDYYHSGATDCSVRVIGGPLRAAGKPAPGRVALFGGGSSSNNLTYDVRKGGYLLSRDMWYETNGSPTFMKLTDSGTFTLHGGIIALPAKVEVPAVLLDGFRGKASFLTTEWATVGGSPVVAKATGAGAQLRLLLLGCHNRSNVSEYLTNDSTGGRAAMTACHIGTDRGHEPIANVGTQDDAFLRGMLAQTRTEQPRPVLNLGRGVPDVRLYRVFVDSCTVGVRLGP